MSKSKTAALTSRLLKLELNGETFATTRELVAALHIGPERFNRLPDHLKSRACKLVGSKNKPRQLKALDADRRSDIKERLRGMVEHWQSQDIEIASVNIFAKQVSPELGIKPQTCLEILRERDLYDMVDRLTTGRRREAAVREALTREIPEGASMLRFMATVIPDVAPKTAVNWLARRESLKQEVADRLGLKKQSGAKKLTPVAVSGKRSQFQRRLDAAKPAFLIKLQRWYGGECDLERLLSCAGFAARPEKKATKDSRKQAAVRWTQRQPELELVKYDTDVQGFGLGYRVRLAQSQQGVA